MESVIDHCCYTFMREVLVWKSSKNGKSTYLTSGEISDERRHKEAGIFMVLQPELPGVKSKHSDFRHSKKLDLTLSDDSFQTYARYKNDPFSNPEDILNLILVKKLESINSSDIPEFLNGQLELFNYRGGETPTFYRYTKMLIENHKQPWATKYSTWLKNNDPEKEKEPSTRKNQGTARQIAISFYYLTKSAVLDFPNRSKRESAHFLEFFSGISYDHLEDKLRYKKLNQFMGIKTKDDVEQLMKDLKEVEKFFSGFKLNQPLRLLKKDVLVLEELADSMVKN